MSADKKTQEYYMANWIGVKSFLKQNYANVKDEGNQVIFTVSWNDGRSQVVFADMHVDSAGAEWVSLESPVGVISPSYLNAALEFINGYFCGGLVKIGDTHYVRHAAPVADISERELLAPLKQISTVADETEKRFVGGDAN
jgi:hypothetical protein